MSNYFASEVGLTKATKELWQARPEPVVYPMPEFDPKPYSKPAHQLEVKRYVKKRNVKSRMSEEQLESFQHHRIFSVIRGMN